MRVIAVFGLAAVAFSATVMAAGCDKKNENAKPSAGQDQPAAGHESPAAATRVSKLGKELAGADEVAVADLLADPKKYEGQIVRVAGKIDDFCHHKRAWFGVTAESGKGMVRVFAAPRFEAPADCKGKQAVAEGKVEIITIPPDQIEHYDKEHKFLAGVKVEPGKPVLRPVVRAFGAEMRQESGR